MARILISDSLGSAGVELLRAEGHEVVLLEEQDRPRLAEVLGGFESLIVRSATQVDRALLEAGSRLQVVGRAGIGVDNIDVAAATELGILVVNAPTANAMSATEHTFALLLAAARRVAAADGSMKAGIWDRKQYVGQELYGKTLGVIGFGQIGQRVASRAQAFEMKVVAYDPYLNAEVAAQKGVESMSIDDLLRCSDAITFHTPLTDETRNLLSAERFELLRPGAIVVNCGRGGVLDEEALLQALESGRVAAAGLDVFAQEPPPSFALAKHPRVVATPHIGAQTSEAQERISTETARMVAAALAGSLTVAAVNLPFRADATGVEPYLRLAERLGRLAASVLGPGGAQRLRLELWGLPEGLQAPLKTAATKGALGPSLGPGVNFVNALTLAAARGLHIEVLMHSEPTDWSELVGVTLAQEARRVEVAGTLYGKNDPRVVRYQGHGLEFRPEGRLLIFRNRDIPGVVGKLGTLLGAAGVNIADIHLAQIGDDQALAVLRLDREPSPGLLRELRSLPEVVDCHSVSLDG